MKATQPYTGSLPWSPFSGKCRQRSLARWFSSFKQSFEKLKSRGFSPSPRLSNRSPVAFFSSVNSDWPEGSCSSDSLTSRRFFDFTSSVLRFDLCLPLFRDDGLSMKVERSRRVGNMISVVCGQASSSTSNSKGLCSLQYGHRKENKANLFLTSFWNSCADEIWHPLQTHSYRWSGLIPEHCTT